MSVTQNVANVVKTTLFLILIWSIFLFALPIGISVVEIEAGLQRFPPQTWLSGPLFFISTLLVVWAAMTMAIKGDGTPAPIDRTRELVTSGPYAYLRHPFVAGVTGQIVALGIAFGSIPVIAYAALCFVVWYYGVRPGEERALEERFGDRFRAYRRRVRGFRARLRTKN
jgi:protein-S-isoprenylcysteine O-methyltransferase Ste14